MRKSIADKIILLALSSFVIKMLGFIFRIYLADQIGSEGMGLYQLVLSVYAFGATLSTSGISTAISRLVAIHPKNAVKIFKNGILITQLIAWSVMVMVFINAEYICSFFIRDARCIASVRIVSLSFPAISLFACISGYFNGLYEVKYPIRGQIAEQLVRIFFIMALVSRGIENGLESAIIITSWGIVLGEYISAAYILMKYKSNSKSENSCFSKRGYGKEIIKICIPLSVNGYVQSFLHTIENMIIPAKFVLYGFTHKEALGFLGMIKGMAMPLIFFPTVVLSSVSTVSLPHISGAQRDKNKEGINRAIKKSILLSLATGIGIMIFFLIFGNKLSEILYKNSEVSDILKKLSFVIPLMYMNITLSGILNGLGKQTFMTFSALSGGGIRTLLIILLVPQYGFNGYVEGMLISESLTLILNFFGIKNSKY